MKLLVVIVNYKVAHLTIDCLRSLSGEVESVPGTHVAVCENGTGDDSAERIQKAIVDNGWGAWCSLTAVTPNLGFPGGNNLVLREALESDDPPQYVLQLNADTAVRQDALKGLVDFMDRHPEVGLAGSFLENPDGTPQASVFRFPTPFGEFDHALKLGLVSRLFRHWVIAPPMPKESCEAEWVSGASIIIRRQVYRDIGLLDEDYYSFYDDVDFCFNARKAGWPTWYVLASRVMHIGGQSTGITIKKPKRLPSYAYEARRRYLLKNLGPGMAALTDAALILGLALWRLRVLFGKKDVTPPHYLLDSIRHSVFLTGFKLKAIENPALAVSTPITVRKMDQVSELR
jgi:GT2 family glycosyltransferase